MLPCVLLSGAFRLAAAMIVHSLLTETGNVRLQRIALVIWPLIAGVPAFGDELVDFGTVVSAQGGNSAKETIGPCFLGRESAVQE